MKQRYIILLFLLAGAAGAFWFGRARTPGQFTPGPELSATALARVRISGGAQYALAIAPNGSLWSWGDASSALGQGNVSRPVKSPQRIGVDNDWAEIYAGYHHALAIGRDGSLWAWGSNPAGLLGDGTEQPRDKPTRVGAENNWRSAGAGLHHSAALKRDGTIWAWGANGNGQLGSAAVTATTTNTSYVPVQVGTATNWMALAVGSLANAALRDDGTLWTWGDGHRTPQVAPGLAANNFDPIQLGTNTNWVSVAAGYYHFIALQNDGSLWSWGRNGHLIHGIPAQDAGQPRRYGTNTHWTTVLDGAYENFAQQRDGSWWELGSGNGRAVLASPPGPWSRLAAGPFYNLAVTPDGGLWHWGAILGEKQGPGMIRALWDELLNMTGVRKNPPRSTTPLRGRPAQISLLPADAPAPTR